MIILLNPKAGGGTALSKWGTILPELPLSGEDILVKVLEHREDLQATIAGATRRGETHFVAAGGDGTVHDVLNALMYVPDSVRSKLVLGAIGLGSSNDYHKPFSVDSTIAGVPAKVDFRRWAWHDVGVAMTRGADGASTRFFLINASAGITAEGNAFFNQPDRLLALLKRRWTSAGIIYAAMHALVCHRNHTAYLELCAGMRCAVSLTNLGIVKNPHFSGSLRYDDGVVQNDGNFRVYVAREMKIRHRLALFYSLARGRFPTGAHTDTYIVPRVTLRSASAIPLECDGETFSAREAVFSLLPQSIKVCL
jgi:diacylglycerol kinase (ATP)